MRNVMLRDRILNLREVVAYIQMFDKILVTIDGRGGAESAISRAFDLARAFDSSVHVLYVVEREVRPLRLILNSATNSDDPPKNEDDRQPHESRNERQNSVSMRREPFAKECRTDSSSITRTSTASI